MPGVAAGNHGATEPPYRVDDGSYHHPPLYGDRTVIESKYLDLALAIAESSQALVKWEQVDAVVLDVSCHSVAARSFTLAVHLEPHSFTLPYGMEG